VAINKQATKPLGFDAREPTPIIRVKRKGARARGREDAKYSTANKENATNENNELLGKTEFYSWKFVCIRGSNRNILSPALNAMEMKQKNLTRN